MPNLRGESHPAAHELFGAEYSGSDTVTINVYSDSCQAAQSLLSAPDRGPQWKL